MHPKTLLILSILFLSIPANSTPDRINVFIGNQQDNTSLILINNTSLNWNSLTLLYTYYDIRNDTATVIVDNNAYILPVNHTPVNLLDNTKIYLYGRLSTSNMTRTASKYYFYNNSTDTVSITFTPDGANFSIFAIKEILPSNFNLTNSSYPNNFTVVFGNDTKYMASETSYPKQYLLTTSSLIGLKRISGIFVDADHGFDYIPDTYICVIDTEWRESDTNCDEKIDKSEVNRAVRKYYRHEISYITLMKVISNYTF
ncbi:MAG: hypothetical protein WC623_21760 [Pedobacter sp.]|uniref:hypothetical protein n=1 Tax=Pedobacter sp. TaxID=1411316 RepID=UPI003561B9ED